MKWVIALTVFVVSVICFIILPVAADYYKNYKEKQDDGRSGKR